MKNQGRQKLTRYHLVSQKARHCEPVRTLAWQSRGASAFLDAVTGATREWLPIDIPAPRPCSAPFLRPFSAAGVLCGSICAYSSLHRLFWDCTAYYSHKPADLSTIICPSCEPPPQPRKNAAATGGSHRHFSPLHSKVCFTFIPFHAILFPGGIHSTILHDSHPVRGQ